MTWEGLSPPYATLVVDPPWAYGAGWPMSNGQGQKGNPGRRALGYSSLSVDDIAAMPVASLAASDAHLFLWTTNRYLHSSFAVVEAWGFHLSQTLVWCKPPRGMGPGGAFASTTEFIVYARRGKPVTTGRIDSSWWQWSRRRHSVKPPEFLDIVERVAPGPYCELFARAPRLGWDHWGYGYEQERVS